MELSVPDRTISSRASTGSAKRWFSRPRFVRSCSAGSPCLVIHTWCPPVRVGQGSRASDRPANWILCEHFKNVRHFARETYARLFNCAAASLPWRLLRTYLESCANIVQSVVYCSPYCPPSCWQSVARHCSLKKSVQIHADS